MSHRKWLDNAFWETETKEQLNCILEIEDDVGRSVTQVMKLNKLTREGEPNPDYIEVVESLGEESIDKTTAERAERKIAEVDEEKQREVEHVKARKLEKLFNYKLEVFEVDEVKKSTNRKLKAKLRRAKSKIEVNMWATKILEETLCKVETDDEK